MHPILKAVSIHYSDAHTQAALFNQLLHNHEEDQGGIWLLKP